MDGYTRSSNYIPDIPKYKNKEHLFYKVRYDGTKTIIPQVTNKPITKINSILPPVAYSFKKGHNLTTPNFSNNSIMEDIDKSYLVNKIATGTSWKRKRYPGGMTNPFSQIFN